MLWVFVLERPSKILNAATFEEFGVFVSVPRAVSFMCVFWTLLHVCVCSGLSYVCVFWTLLHVCVYVCVCSGRCVDLPG